MRYKFVKGVQTLAEIRAELKRIRAAGDYIRAAVSSEMSEMLDTIDDIDYKIHKVQILWASLQHLSEVQTKQNSKSAKGKSDSSTG